MMHPKLKLQEQLSGVLASLFPETIGSQALVQETKAEFEGDFTLVSFPYTRFSKLNPAETAKLIGEELSKASDLVVGYNVVNGFLNISLTFNTWFSYFLSHSKSDSPIDDSYKPEKQRIVIEYSSPNTNKPLHLGHIRNNLLGFSIAELLKSMGHDVIRVNLINDRGIHICKSMVAWLNSGARETPESSGIKGDHLVGKYYVLFDKQYKAEIETLMTSGLSEDDAKKQAQVMKQAQELLRKWEEGDAETLNTWKTMNGWVYDGFDITYKRLGVAFEKFYYESQTYLLGKNIVSDGLQKGVFYRKDDGSVWIDLRNEGLDEKVLLRSDGTSVYMTQDLGTALERANEWNASKYIYVVGNEQDYHFKVLQKALLKMGYKWAEGIYHLSYGMVDLPSGKMKSREGTVVDADDLMEEVVQLANQKGEESGKMTDFSADEKTELFEKVGLGALKYFILKVDPKKRMVFNPSESIDLNGHTGPFIQYTYTRIQSLLRKAGEFTSPTTAELLENSAAHIELLKKLASYSEVVLQASIQLNPSMVANYCFELAQQYNTFYHEAPVLREENQILRAYRLAISSQIASVLAHGMGLLGISMPERM